MSSHLAKLKEQDVTMLTKVKEQDRIKSTSCEADGRILPQIRCGSVNCFSEVMIQTKLWILQ